MGQLQTALARIAELEARPARLEKPSKTPDSSSLPPCKGQKSDDQATGEKPPRKSRPGFGRALDPNPDRVVDLRFDACPHCEAAWPAGQTPQQVYDRIELPPIKPDVTRVRLFGGRCACCGERAVAAAPEGLAPGSPFGKSIEAIAVYLHDAQAIGIERLRLVFGEVFGLSIPVDALASGSEGAICNILARAQAPLQGHSHPQAPWISQALANDPWAWLAKMESCSQPRTRSRRVSRGGQAGRLRPGASSVADGVPGTAVSDCCARPGGNPPQQPAQRVADEGHAGRQGRQAIPQREDDEQSAGLRFARLGKQPGAVVVGINAQRADQVEEDRA